MKVWILIHRIPYEGDSITGVYETEEIAKQYMEEDKKDIYIGKLFIEEHRVRSI